MRQPDQEQQDTYHVSKKIIETYCVCEFFFTREEYLHEYRKRVRGQHGGLCRNVLNIEG